MKDQYAQALFNQKKNLQLNNEMVDRSKFDELKHYFAADNRINIVTGLRRTGKSTLLKSLMLSLDNFIFINFDDERLSDFKYYEFEDLNETAIMVYGESQYYFFDEIQNVDGFETFVRRLQDENKKIVITGSNASLLSVELGTKLTGRYKSFELYPFSFSEFLELKKVKYTEESFYVTDQKVELIKMFNTWFNTGGLPEYLQSNDDDYVKTLYENILYRDIVVRYKIKKVREIKELTHILTSNLSLPFTYNSLKNTLGLSNSDMVKEYFGYLSNSWLFFELRKYAPSLKQQLRAPRKAYMIDLAFNNIIGFRTSENLGCRLENLVYIYLKQHFSELFYFNEGGECDFVCFNNSPKPELFQVCYELNAQNEDREKKGLLKAMNYFEVSQGTILTFSQQNQFKIDNKSINIVPIWKWMLTHNE